MDSGRGYASSRTSRRAPRDGPRAHFTTARSIRRVDAGNSTAPSAGPPAASRAELRSGRRAEAETYCFPTSF